MRGRPRKKHYDPSLGIRMDEREREVLVCLQQGYEIRVPKKNDAMPYLRHPESGKFASCNITNSFFTILITADLIERVQDRGKQNHISFRIRRK